MVMNNGWLDAIGAEYLNTNPGTAAWQFVFGPLLGGRNQNFNKWLRGQQGDMFQDYQAAVAGDPNLRALDFYQGKDPMQDFLKLAPSQRGISAQSFAPRTKMNFGIGWG